MQPRQQQTQNKNILLYNWEALKVCLPYLKLSDLLGSATVSKQWQYHLKKYIKQYILPQQQINLHSDAFQAAKIMFNRKVIIRNHNQNKQIQFPQICSRVEVGNHATLLQTLQGNTYVIKTDLLMTMGKKDWTDPNKVMKMPSKFTKSKCVGNYIYFIGENHMLRYTTTQQFIRTEEQVFQFAGTIEYFIASISAVVIVLNHETKQKHFQYLFFTHKEPNPKKVQIPLNVQNPLNDIVLTFAEHGFIISNQGTLYQADFQQNPVKLTQVKALKGKCISKIKCGAKHYFAYESKKKLIKNWTNADVLKWAEQQGFQDYIKILRAQKVTGDKLLQMDKTYMQDVLGMTSNLTQQKITVFLQQGSKATDKFQDYIVHGWGKNDKGQLCMNPSGNISNPVKTKLADHIQIFACFGDHTILRNNMTHQLTINDLDDKQKLRWEPVTQNKVWALSGHKHIIVYCESMGKKWVSQSMCEQPIHNKKQKLRTAKNIMDQIQWDSKYKPQQFSVGYLNRHEGTLECGFEQFLKSDVKQNSILYFKQNGKTVWDKKNRLDIL